MIIFITGWLALAQAAKMPEDALKFTNGQQSYTLTKSAGRLAFAEKTSAWQINIQECNRSLVDSYWKKMTDAVTQAKRGKSSANSVLVVFNGVSTSLRTSDKSFATLVRGDREALMLRTLSDHACASKKGGVR